MGGTTLAYVMQSAEIFIAEKYAYAVFVELCVGLV
jgi:hypothetical protein